MIFGQFNDDGGMSLRLMPKYACTLVKPSAWVRDEQKLMSENAGRPEGLDSQATSASGQVTWAEGPL